MTFGLLDLAKELDLPRDWIIETSNLDDFLVIRQRDDEWHIRVPRKYIEDAGTLAQAVAGIKAMVQERIRRYARGEHEH